MSEEKAGYGERVTNLVLVARTVTTLTSGDDVETTVTEQWGLPCKVTAKEDAKGVEHYEVEYRGGGPEESGNGAIVEGARLRALRDGRMTISRDTAVNALAVLNGLLNAPEPYQRSIQELRTVLAGFTVKGKDGV